MVMVAGPKLKLSILTTAPLAGLSTAFCAGIAADPALTTKAAATIAASATIHFTRLISVSPLNF
jgi:hypothetical protein